MKQNTSKLRNKAYKEIKKGIAWLGYDGKHTGYYEKYFKILKKALDELDHLEDAIKNAYEYDEEEYLNFIEIIKDYQLEGK